MVNQTDTDAVEKVKRVGNYRLGRTLGKGAFGRVKAAVHVDTNQNVAIKILKREDIIRNQMTDSVKNEIDVFRRLGQHENIVSMLDVMATSTKIYIVMELALGGELLYHIADQPFTEDQAFYFFNQLLRGLDFCHRNSVCHRDIKPENMLLTDSGMLKITDFGLAVLLDQSMIVRGVAGTPSYMAPEVESIKGYEGIPADVWSCGVVLYLFLTGKLPFLAPNSHQLREKIRHGEFSYPPSVSPLARDLINIILVPDPRKRAGIRTITKHEWMKQKNTKKSIAYPFLDAEGSQEDGTMCTNAFELLSLAGAFQLDRLLTPHIPQHITRFFTSEPLMPLLTQLTNVLCRLPLTFKVFERKMSICIQAPHDNGMIVALVQIYQTKIGLSVVEFKHWRGDMREFVRIYREVCDGLGRIVIGL